MYHGHLGSHSSRVSIQRAWFVVYYRPIRRVTPLKKHRGSCILFQLDFSSGGRSSAPGSDLGRSTPGRAPTKYDSVYPIFRLAAQVARSRSGRELRRSHLAAMPRLWTRFDHRAWTPSQAGARCASRLDWDPSGSLHGLREDLHVSSTAFSPIHTLQFADALSRVTTALCEALFLGRGHACAERS